MKIRSATQFDIPCLTALWEERLLVISQSDPRFSEIQTKRVAWLSEITRKITEEDSIVYVAGLATNHIVGYITGHMHQDGYGVIEEIALDSHAYHAGMGRALLDAMQQWIANQNALRTIVSVPRYHAVEQAFWRALGAVEWTDEDWLSPQEFIWMTL